MRRGQNRLNIRLAAILTSLTMIACMFLYPARPASAASPTITSTASDPFPWERVELWADSASQMINGQEPVVKAALPENDKVRNWFPADIFVKDGSSTSSNDYNFGDYGHLKSNRFFLLGYGPGWKNATKPYPVLLVHGASDDMNRAWAHPWDKQTPASITNPGLMQYLANKGYAVFAISFPHVHGNNLIQGQLIADAIDVIKSRTGASQVDVVAHSKGNMAVAAPFKGLDTMFRYYTANTTVISNNSDGPVAFWEAYIYYAYRYYKRWDMTSTYSGNFYQGQTQLLHNWVDDPDHPIGFNAESWTSDANETMLDLYYGGQSIYITSEGIDNAISDPSGTSGTNDFIAKLNGKGLDPNVKLYTLYGTNQVWDYTWWGYQIGEKADASDGLLFVASATYTQGVTRRGAPLMAKTGMNCNHLDIARNNEAMAWIEQQLAQ